MTHEPKPIKTLEEYLDAIKKITKPQGGRRFIYRGQKNKDWNIQSSALRRLQKTQEKYPNPLSDLSNFFVGYINQIIDEVQLRYSNIYKDLTDLECMAHMQHNRTATGLIDFTYNPLNALWFACDTDGSTDGKIFVIDTQDKNYQIEEIKTRKALKEELSYFFEKDKSWYLWQPSIGKSNIDTERITIQQSIFLFGAPEVPKDMIKGEILISGEHKGKLLKELETMGILEKTLFPDLAGFFERSAVNSTYNNELADQFYIEQIRKSEEVEDKDKEALASNYFQRGNFRSALEDYEGAIKNFDEAIKINPNDASAYTNRGIIKDHLELHEKAIEDFDEAIKINPKYAVAYTNKGIAKANLELHKEAIKNFDEAIKINPNDAIAYTNKGVAKAKLGQYEEAIQNHDQAINIIPILANPYYNRGNAKAKLKQYREAIRDFNKAININPKYTIAYNNRGIAKFELGKHEEAIKDYHKAININPKLATVYYNRGNAYLCLNKWEDAKADLTTAKNKGADIVGLFQDEFKSVSDFEKKYNVKLPDDIKAMLE